MSVDDMIHELRLKGFVVFHRNAADDFSRAATREKVQETCPELQARTAAALLECMSPRALEMLSEYYAPHGLSIQLTQQFPTQSRHNDK